MSQQRWFVSVFESEGIAFIVQHPDTEDEDCNPSDVLRCIAHCGVGAMAAEDSDAAVPEGVEEALYQDHHHLFVVDRVMFYDWWKAVRAGKRGSGLIGELSIGGDAIPSPWPVDVGSDCRPGWGVGA